ncbi:uncharacterized protein LOC128248050 [Octopus bimaculoides]|uniref:uncharacterized protein LOC128248050 n=1 Tax=Octopus bimaculoides TaxID=37653 RepID=UPI0022E11797|nr:uncharacterized protein LOC128248050 [Octopus bimaculoides]
MKYAISMCFLTVVMGILHAPPHQFTGDSLGSNCTEAFDSRCPSIKNMSMISGHCKRLLAYQRCGHPDEECKGYFEKTFNVECCGRTKLENCLQKAQHTCKHALILHPISKPDKHYCRRLLVYATCASAIKNYECKSYFSNLYFGECKAHLESRHCMALYRQSCFEAVRDYPISQPDFEYCKRLVVLKQCAELEKNTVCAEFFKKLIEKNCPPADKCMISFKEICPEAEKKYPILIPDTNYCSRLRVYEVCAYSKSHSCKLHFNELIHAICEAHEEQRDCMEIYRTTCFKAFNDYPELNPDTSYCKRLFVFQKCAEGDDNKHCMTYFDAISKIQCGEENICVHELQVKCPSGEKLYPIGNPDFNYCKRIAYYRTCSNDISKRCEDFFQRSGLDKCPKIDSCIEEAKDICPDAEKLYPKLPQDTNLCKRLMLYITCADEKRYHCQDHIVKIYREKCRTPLEAADCQGVYSSTCYPGIRDYPVTYPDTNICPRLVVFKTCADKYADKHCFQSFQNAYKVYCPEKDSCTDLFKVYCPEAEEQYPIREDDINLCNRLLTYETCAIHKKHNCTNHFYLTSLALCEGFEVRSDCENRYLPQCTQILKHYPLKSPDPHSCARLVLYKTCAQKHKDHHCMEAFQRRFESDCPSKDDCMEIYKRCPIPVRDIPLDESVMNEEDCKRLDKYERCSTEDQRCSNLFQTMFSVLCYR